MIRKGIFSSFICFAWLVLAMNAGADNEAVFDKETGMLNIPSVVIHGQAWEIDMHYSQGTGLSLADVRAAAPVPAYSDLARSWGSIYAHWLQQGAYALLWNHTSDILKQKLGGDQAVFFLLAQDLASALGSEKSKLRDHVVSIDDGAGNLYERAALFTNLGEPAVLELWLDGAFKIFNLGFRELKGAVISNYLDYQTVSDLILPFTGGGGCPSGAAGTSWTITTWRPGPSGLPRISWCSRAACPSAVWG